MQLGLNYENNKFLGKNDTKLNLYYFFYRNSGINQISVKDKRKTSMFTKEQSTHQTSIKERSNKITRSRKMSEVHALREVLN